jgi:hypothetical protein
MASIRNNHLNTNQIIRAGELAVFPVIILDGSNDPPGNY